MKQLLTIMVFIYSINSISQVSININNMQYNTGGNIANCGTIDLGTNSTVHLNCTINLQKSYSNALGDCTVKVFSKKNTNSNEIEIAFFNMPMSSWWDDQSNSISTYQQSVPLTLSATDYETSGGILYAKIIRNSDALSYSTPCNYGIIKTQLPTFNLTPTSLSIPCGSTTAQNFTVNNVYNSPGTISYLWEVGPSWKFSTSGVACANTFSTASNVLSLTPNTFPLANVKVTPILNGVSYPQKTCTVSLAPFTGNFNIVGSSGLCTSGVYSVSGLPTGSTITWSSSNTSIASLSAPSNTQVTANMVSNGTFTLTATVQNPCGQMLVLSKVISVGQPGAVYWVDKVEPYMYQFNAYDYWGCTQNVNTYVWQIVAQTGGVYSTYLGGDLTSIYAVPPFSIHMTLTASNGCASSSQDIYLSLNSEEEELYRIKPKEYPNAVIFPNPSNTEITIKFPFSKNSNQTKVLIYNSLGKIIDVINVENDQFIYNVEKLSKGVYFVEYNLGEIKNTSKFIVD